MKWIIVDRYSNDKGYGFNSPIEGWIFTILKSAATRFNSKQEAQEAIKKHYPRLVLYLTVEMDTDSVGKKGGSK
jgi:hypothetical protein